MDSPAIGLRKSDRTTQNNISTTPSKPGKLSFAERKAQMSHPSKSRLVEGDHIMRDIDRAPPGDVVTKARKSLSRPDLTKQRSNFFEDAFSVKEAHPAKERVRSEAIVMAEVRTNVIITDEFTFITELSYHLSTRYQRPISSIVVTLQHGACMLFGGTFDPAYVMSVFALPSQLQPTTNKRNAALIQKHMEEELGVVPSRGFLRFVPTTEEHAAWNGKTLAGEIDELEKNSGVMASDDAISIISRRSKPKKRLSVRSLGTFKAASAANTPAEELTPPASAGATPPSMAASMPAVLQTPEEGPAPPKTAKRRKSFVATIFGRSGAKEARLSLPTQAE